MSTISLPRIDSAVLKPDGRMNREWYKALTTTTESVNGILNGQDIYTDTGTVNKMVISSGATALTRGLSRYLQPKFTNTSTLVTLNDSGLGAQNVVATDGSAPAVGQLVANQTIQVIYDGAQWELQPISSANQSINGNLQVAGTLNVTGASTLTGGVTGAMAATGAVSGTTVTASGYVATGAVLVSALPAAGTAGVGARHFVTDATSTTFASVVAGTGANKVPVYSDGTNWRIG